MKKALTAARAARQQQWLQRIDSALRAQGPDAAGRLALQAAADGVEHVAVLNLAAQQLYDERRYDEAVKLLTRARASAPMDPHLANTLGMCFQALNRADAALKAYGAALRIDPAMAAVHFNRATLLEAMDDLTAARLAYERASAADPRYVEPLASLAWLDARSGDSESARRNGQRALALSPANGLARMALASADLQDGKLAAAEERLSALAQDPALRPVNRAIVLGMIGDLKDAQRQTSQAFAAYAAANDQLRSLNASRFERPGIETPSGHARRLLAWFQTADPAPWRDTPPARAKSADPAAHVFLVGFPRSGTTLLETVLAAHPEVVTLEEKDSLAQSAATFLTSDESLERLARIGSGEALRQREAYWSAVRGFRVEPRGRVFIDKMPLATVLLPLIAKLFPNARILFALRDPRDVVLSCFRRRFGMNAAMYQFLTLEGAAAYYDAVMQLAAAYRGILPLSEQVIRYESMVEDFDGTVRSVCEFVGLEWHSGMADFAAAARSRAIATPSAAQVARGLNRDGRGAWRRYEAQMTPVLPILEPWVKRFGYD